MKKLIAIFILSSFVLLACEDKAAAEVTKLKAEVIAVHDEVMPKMTEIAGLQKQITAKVGSLTTETPISDSALQVVNVAKGLLENLESAEKSMNDWMMSFHEVDQQKVDAKTMLDALKGEQTKINGVKDDMLGAIKEAKAFLAK